MTSRVGRITLQCIERGFYEVEGAKVDIREAMDAAIAGTVWYTPSQSADAKPAAALVQAMKGKRTEVEVTGETTLGACARLLKQPGLDVLALNFASAKSPGGGFLGGSRAQEESIALASALYPCLTKHAQLYTDNRNQPNHGLYSHNLVYSPRVPVFRADDDSFLRAPFCPSFITCPAVNRRGMARDAVDDNTRAELDGRCRDVMVDRIARILRVAAAHGHSHLVLGAYGCGAFRQRPDHVARWFHDALEGEFKNVFARVVFAVHGGYQPNLQWFEHVFIGGDAHPAPPVRGHKAVDTPNKAKAKRNRRPSAPPAE